MPLDVENARIFTQRAIQFDNRGNTEAAIYYYNEALRYLNAVINNDSGSEDDIERYKSELQKIRNRCEALEEIARKTKESVAQSESQQIMQRCNFLFSQALDADERDHKDVAVRLYSETAEFALTKMKECTCDETVQGKLRERAEQSLDRAEEIKGISSRTTSPSSVVPSVSVRVRYVDPNRKRNDEGHLERKHFPNGSEGEANQRPPLHRGSSAHLKISGGTTVLSNEEKQVLLETSKINGIRYVPFMDIDLQERFQYALPFSDKDGPLKLSPKQKLYFVKWARPEEIYGQPRMIHQRGVDYQSIKQTIISDCSFVASLAVSALYESRFNKKLITPIIYPRNKNKEPIYNPFGKYMVKLHLNGVPRKIVLDDTLPVGRYGDPLCSYSTNKGEIWISLLEKAYMKVMGGYDFPGSNSNIDLHALTGWIPERIAIRNTEPDFNGAAVFNMLEERLRNGHCLGTVATGTLSDAEANRTGLVPTHAYAILDVRSVKNVKLMKLKNPWSHVRWRGNYSELDVAHWTSELRAELNYDLESASVFDNGIFWIDYDSILNFFDVFYINWNPELFSYTYCIHQMWQAGVGPAKDAYNIGDNPQFRLHVPGTKSGSVWVLLTRHITDAEDFKDNQEFITVLVYKNNGKRVYYPRDPEPYIDGIRINSPHYLCKVLLGESSERTYTLVISQYEKMNNIYYTLRAYSNLPFTLNKIESSWNFSKEVSGEWDGFTAGGCANHPHTYKNNPRFQLKLSSSRDSHTVLIDLKGPRQYQIGFDVVCVECRDSSVSFPRKSSEPYRSGFVILELDAVPPGIYNIIPSTYFPNCIGPFILSVKSTGPFSLQ